MCKNMIKLSVALATHNEEENLPRCLDSVRQLAEEIVIVDGSSTDKTVEIAKNYGARVLVRENPPIFHINKQKALEMCRGEWILQLDADEVVSPELAGEIKKVVLMSNEEIGQRKFPDWKTRLFERHQKLVEERDGKIGSQTGEVAAFFIPRKNYFLGSFLRYGGVYPDGVVRLVRNGKAKFPCKSVHEKIEIDGRVGWLENDLLHYDSPTFSRYLARADRYTTLTAEELRKSNLQINFQNTLYYLLFKPKIEFLKRVFRHRAYKDGFPGIIFALFSALHYPIAFLKYWELKIND